MPGPDLRFDIRDLPAAALDSCLGSYPFLRDHRERAVVAIQLGLLAGQRLSALHHDVDVLRIQLNAVADALGQFCCRKRGAAAQDWFVDQPPRFVWFRIGRRIRSTGFCVGWSNFSSSDPP